MDVQQEVCLVWGFLGFFCPLTYCSQLHVLGDAVLPGEAEDVRQVKGEVDDAAAGGSQVGLVEEDAHEEALHDGGDGEGQQEEEDKDGVAVIQHLSSLWGQPSWKTKTYSLYLHIFFCLFS